jgi:hypothetical protein
MRWPEAARPPAALAAAALAAAAGAAGAATGNVEYVTDPQMCRRPPAETQEMGMRLDPTGMWTIEYTCEWQGAVDFDSPEVQLRLGYCSEPGALYPGVFAVVRDGDAVHVYQGDEGEPQVFLACE